MSIELMMVACVIAPGMVQLMVTASALRRVHGVAWANSARDMPSGKSDTPMLGRLQRAQSNLMETLPFFVGLALIIHIAEVGTPLTASAAIVFAVARLVHFPLYAFGVPWLRGIVWTVSFVALGVLAYVVLAAAPWGDLLH